MREKLESIIRGAGDIILEAQSFAVEEKAGHANYVTSVDEKVQAWLVEQLHALLPEASLIGEEQANAPLGDEYTWVIDPLDGTTNFIHDFHFSAVSIALLKEKQPVLAAVYQPYSKELFMAEKGKGATLNGKPIHVSDNDLPHALVGFGTSPYSLELAEKSLEIALHYLHDATDVRRCGSAALDLSYIACGRHDVFFELSLSPWDFAAGALLVTEAGGVFAMPPRGVDFSKPGTVFAANAAAAQDALKLFESHL